MLCGATVLMVMMSSLDHNGCLWLVCYGYSDGGGSFDFSWFLWCLCCWLVWHIGLLIITLVILNSCCLPIVYYDSLHLLLVIVLKTGMATIAMARAQVQNNQKKTPYNHCSTVVTYSLKQSEHTHSNHYTNLDHCNHETLANETNE